MSSYIGYSQCGDVVLGTYSYEIFPPASQLSPVVQQVDDTIQRINLYPMDTVVGFPLILIHWIVIYPEDTAIQLLNNWHLNLVRKITQFF